VTQNLKVVVQILLQLMLEAKNNAKTRKYLACGGSTVVKQFNHNAKILVQILL
jgi:hypothetical protein